MQSNTRSPDTWLSLAFAFVGGYGDAASVILAKTFTGHITGALVLAAVAIADQQGRALLTHLSAVLSFLAGVVFSVLMGRSPAARASLSQLLPTVVGIEMILTVGAYVALASQRSPGAEIFVVCMALALGLQNGAFQRTGGIGVHTTYVTGLITSLISKEVELSRPRDPKLNILYGIWLAFFLGGVAGAVMVLRFKAAGILGAAFLLFVVFIRTRMASRETALT